MIYSCILEFYTLRYTDVYRCVCVCSTQHFLRSFWSHLECYMHMYILIHMYMYIFIWIQHIHSYSPCACAYSCILIIWFTFSSPICTYSHTLSCRDLFWFSFLRSEVWQEYTYLTHRGFLCIYTFDIYGYVYLTYMCMCPNLTYRGLVCIFTFQI